MLVGLEIKVETKEEKLPNYLIFSKFIQECEFVLCNKIIAKFSDVWQAGKRGSKLKLTDERSACERHSLKIFNDLSN